MTQVSNDWFPCNNTEIEIELTQKQKDLIESSSLLINDIKSPIRKTFTIMVGGRNIKRIKRIKKIENLF